MPLVNIMVNGRAYTIACDDGEEAHLKELAAHVDAKAREVLGSVGQVGDSRMLLMAALLIADEHHELAGAAAAGTSSDGDKQSLHLRAEKAESAAADALESAAKRLEDIAVRLAHA
jgi:cell division protein ZapA